MRIENLPRPLPAALYQEAIAAFWELARGHAVALFTAGNVNFPGLSDLDLVLVPADQALAPLYLRAGRRLPPRFQAILHHEPFILPLEHLQVFKYSFLSNVTLRHGPDLLAGVAPDRSISGQICTALEGLFSYLAFLDALKTRRVLDAAYCLPVFSSLRFTIRILADLGLVRDGSYGREFDALRQRLLEAGSDPCLPRMFALFEGSLNRCAAAVASALDLDPRRRGQILAFFRRDSFPLAGLARADIEQRRAAITAYFRGLAARNFQYGHLFKTELYPAFSISPWFYPLLVADRLRHRLRNRPV
ncbi:MAG: hypothetical protein ACE5H9_13235 [Anaerolineae bacterium]